MVIQRRRIASDQLRADVKSYCLSVLDEKPVLPNPTRPALAKYRTDRTTCGIGRREVSTSSDISVFELYDLLENLSAIIDYRRNGPCRVDSTARVYSPTVEDPLHHL